MKVFNELDKEQAAMYRWIRDTCDQQTLERLIRRPVWSAAGCLDDSPMSRDTLLREAYHQYQTKFAGQKAIDTMVLKSGVLPKELGLALAKYTEAVEECAMFAESFGGPTFSDVNTNLENALADLATEILRIQR